MYLKKIRSTIIIFRFVLFLPSLFLLLSDSTATNSFYTLQNSSNEIIFISDTQDLIFVEYMWNEINNNQEVKKLIFNDIIERNPNSVFHLGDLVALPDLEEDWNQIDNFVERLYKKEIPFYPVLGNHELLIKPLKGETNFQKRFPQHSRTGYSVLIDSVSVILLNSNFGYMTDEEITEQNNWYNNKLNELDSDSSIIIVIVGTHHSPYTNSTMVSPSDEVQKYFVPGYMKSKKGKLFLSGHAHAFEHFIMEGKDFLVIGGGGGPQQRLLVGKDTRWKDHFNSEDEYRRFHYLRLTKETSGYIANVIMIDSTYSNLMNSYQIR